MSKYSTQETNASAEAYQQIIHEEDAGHPSRTKSMVLVSILFVPTYLVSCLPSTPLSPHLVFLARI